MTRDRFEMLHERRGYTVERRGLITILRMVDKDGLYTAYWFFNADGTLDETKKTFWKLEKID